MKVTFINAGYVKTLMSYGVDFSKPCALAPLLEQLPSMDKLVIQRQSDVLVRSTKFFSSLVFGEKPVDKSYEIGDEVWFETFAETLGTSPGDIKASINSLGAIAVSEDELAFYPLEDNEKSPENLGGLYAAAICALSSVIEPGHILKLKLWRDYQLTILK